jgi:DNA-binding FadR family transcriptional regulator
MAQVCTARIPTAHQSPWKPLRRMRTHEQVVAEIEHRLITGALKAGDRLPPERQFAEALGVSRGAVREALRILEAIGVVETGQGSGPASGSMIVKDSVAGMAMVLRMHLQLASFTLEDLIDVGALLEQLVVRKAAENATGARNELAGVLIAALREAQRHAGPVVFGEGIDEYAAMVETIAASQPDVARAGLVSP